jgi:capsular exopolysaccharide synthesis family protein
MGKTFEALERAEKEYQKVDAGPAFDSAEQHILPTPKKSQAQIASCRVVDLKTKLMTHYAAEAIKTIMVTGTAHGSGASTIAISLATALAKDSRRKVLLVDANLRTPGLHDVFKIEFTDGVYDLLNKENGHSLKFRKVGPGELFVLPSGVNRAMGNGYFESPRFDKFMQSARKSFDYVILDSAPIGSFPDSQAICARVDGVILVIESGKTRSQVALRAKKELEDAGGRVLGVILNRQKHYIPEWIYKRL